MWGKYFTKSVQFGMHFVEMSNPKVGNHIIKLQRNSLLIRVDGRSLDHLSQQNGFLPRVDLSKVQNLRYSHVERYQKYNEDPFGWGACASLKDLMVFLEQNDSHVKDAWIHKFYGKATSLSRLKIETGMEVEGRDDEKEEIIMQHVPLQQFIASTCPKYRDKFLNGGVVPNAMSLYNPDLPKLMKKSDLYTESSILAWLLSNKSDQTFVDLCQSLYSDLSEKTLAHRLDGNKLLIDAVKDASEIKVSSSPLM